MEQQRQQVVVEMAEIVFIRCIDYTAAGYSGEGPLRPHAILKLYDEVWSMSTSASPFGTRALDYAQVDVFAEHPLEGNMLGIFLDGRGLTDGEMQALARETNLSETAFLLPRETNLSETAFLLPREEAEEREKGVWVRIFTVQEELPFAGHPTLGTASWLYWNHPVLRGREEIVLDLAGGRIPVRFEPEDGRTGVFGTMRQPEPRFGAMHDRAAVAAAIGMTVDDLNPEMPIQTVSTGMAFCIVPLRSVEVAGRLKIAQGLAQRYLDGSDAKLFYCITRADVNSGADFHARMQWYDGEDPATGSASGCAIAYLVRHGIVVSGTSVVIEQGVEMLRPSRIHVRAIVADKEGGQRGSKMNVFVGGRTILVSSGRFFLP